jgi:hypothetical protein
MKESITDVTTTTLVARLAGCFTGPQTMGKLEAGI